MSKLMRWRNASHVAWKTHQFEELAQLPVSEQFETIQKQAKLESIADEL